eukprot:COSAG01_NODE_362_length_18130_cov_34.672307_4_plen_121_part_00
MDAALAWTLVRVVATAPSRSDYRIDILNQVPTHMYLFICYYVAASCSSLNHWRYMHICYGTHSTGLSYGNTSTATRRLNALPKHDVKAAMCLSLEHAAFHSISVHVSHSTQCSFAPMTMC